jgi:signal peptidase II
MSNRRQSETTLKKPMRRRYIALFVIALLAIDQIVKIWVKTHMTIDQAFFVCGQWFQIRFIENPGFAFGMELGGDYGKPILSLFRIVAVVALIWYINRLIVHGRTSKGVILGFALGLAGALGNIVDSLFYGMIFSESGFGTVAAMFPNGGGYASFLHGKVVDMLYFPIIRTTWPDWMPWVGGDRFVFFSPIFNVADAYVSVAVIYMILFQRKFFR